MTMQWLAAGEDMKKMDHYHGAISTVVTRGDSPYMELALNL